ncbi:hypothetical protein FH972_024262 [Carpinus fangiana]|uniref:Major facilitator superfamily (MFS) profile domain-containing protein n=1 Tax=Carpinus fangiana TaxID=176857 RepID=A0A5N6KXV1_9ROSI|nr:hypothetical protein FH972_024262 [Carpinus fangiana]
MTSTLGKRKRLHPYLSGNFAPIQQTRPLTPCKYTGTIPKELYGGQYVRNGGNPISNDDLGRDAHWFDGDGMLSGVSFRRASDDSVTPEFVNQYILTDILLHTLATPAIRQPILPSIATLVNPLSSLFSIMVSIVRAFFLIMLSKLPGTSFNIKKISVANTAVLYHDGRALATCESGPPMRVQLPSLETVGWYNGVSAEGESATKKPTEVFGGPGLMGFMKEWTTAHPRVDPKTNELILFHSTFAPPFIHYSIVPADKDVSVIPARMLNAPVVGVSSAKMIHDFGVSSQHTVMMDLPLSLDPWLLAKGEAPISYDISKPARFGVFPRRQPSNVRWFETSACCIFHTANTWDVFKDGKIESVDMLACRQTSAAVVFNAGNILAPPPSGKRPVVGVKFTSDAKLAAEGSYEEAPMLESPEHKGFSGPDMDEDDQCRLYYYSFSLDAGEENKITHQWALSSLSFEFPSVRPDREMSDARYVYGCTSCSGTFNTALGRAAKIDGLVKVDVQKLIARGKADPPTSITGCVDNRSVDEIIAANDEADAIQVFKAPPNYYAQEPRFVAAADGTAEDDGFLLTYMFDESQLDKETGEPLPDAASELWIIDARNMRDIIAKIELPQRVPYGLHGNWFPESAILGQRPVLSTRHLRTARDTVQEKGSVTERAGQRLQQAVLHIPVRTSLASLLQNYQAAQQSSYKTHASMTTPEDPAFSYDDAPDLYLFTSLTAGSSHIITATSRLETILKANRIPFKAVDCATDEKARRIWSRRAQGKKLPGLVREGVVLGDLEVIEEWNEYGEIKEHLGGPPLPKKQTRFPDASQNTVGGGNMTAQPLPIRTKNGTSDGETTTSAQTLQHSQAGALAAEAAAAAKARISKAPMPGVNASKIRPMADAETDAETLKNTEHNISPQSEKKISPLEAAEAAGVSPPLKSPEAEAASLDHGSPPTSTATIAHGAISEARLNAPPEKDSTEAVGEIKEAVKDEDEGGAIKPEDVEKATEDADAAGPASTSGEAAVFASVKDTDKDADTQETPEKTSEPAPEKPSAPKISFAPDVTRENSELEKPRKAFEEEVAAANKKEAEEVKETEETKEEVKEKEIEEANDTEEIKEEEETKEEIKEETKEKEADNKAKDVAAEERKETVGAKDADAAGESHSDSFIPKGESQFYDSLNQPSSPYLPHAFRVSAYGFKRVWLQEDCAQARQSSPGDCLRSTVSRKMKPTLVLAQRLLNRTAIVTGSSSGVGRAIALRYSREGARVACADLRPTPRIPELPSTSKSPPQARLHEADDDETTPTHDLITQLGGQATFTTCDVTDEAAMQHLVDRCVATFGALDIMVNNAGVALEARTPGLLHETSTATWDATMAANARSVFLGSRAALTHFLRRRVDARAARGWIVNLSSIYGLVGGANNPAYCASKGAVANLTRQTAVDYARFGVHVNAICPGHIRTAIFEETRATMVGEEELRGWYPLAGWAGQGMLLARRCGWPARTRGGSLGSAYLSMADTRQSEAAHLLMADTRQSKVAYLSMAGTRQNEAAYLRIEDARQSEAAELRRRKKVRRQEGGAEEGWHKIEAGCCPQKHAKPHSQCYRHIELFYTIILPSCYVETKTDPVLKLVGCQQPAGVIAPLTIDTTPQNFGDADVMSDAPRNEARPSRSRASSASRSFRRVRSAAASRSRSRPRSPHSHLHRIYSSGFTDDHGLFHSEHDAAPDTERPRTLQKQESAHTPTDDDDDDGTAKEEVEEEDVMLGGIPAEHDMDQGNHWEQGEKDLERGLQQEPSRKSEKDPNLVTWDGPDDPENPKNWPMRRKWIATFVVSSFTFISPVSSSMVAPALAAMSRDLGVHQEVETSLMLSIFVLAYAVGPLFFGPMSEMFGRVPVLQLANLLYLVFNLACGFAKNGAQMLVFRFLSGLGGSAPLATGGGVLADCFLPEQRGRAISVYSLAPLLGPAVGPIAGGFVAENTTWRWVFWATCIADAAIQVSGLFFLDETYAPKLLQNKLKRIRKETGNTELYTEFDTNEPMYMKLRHSLVRPFRLLGTQPIIQVLAVYMAYLYGICYLVLSTFPTLWTSPEYYNMSVGIGGLNYIALGVGFFLGAQITAPLNDRVYRILKARNNGVGQPEFRVPMMIPGAICVPVGLFWYGWAAQARVHWIVPDIGAAIFSAGIIVGFQSIQTYIVDSYTRFAASGVAAATVLRSLAGFGFPLFAPYMYAALDYGWGNSLLGFIAIALGIPGPLLLWKFGPALRAKSKFAAGGLQPGTWGKSGRGPIERVKGDANTRSPLGAKKEMRHASHESSNESEPWMQQRSLPSMVSDGIGCSPGQRSCQRGSRIDKVRPGSTAGARGGPGGMPVRSCREPWGRKGVGGREGGSGWQGEVAQHVTKRSETGSTAGRVQGHPWRTAAREERLTGFFQKRNAWRRAGESLAVSGSALPVLCLACAVRSKCCAAIPGLPVLPGLPAGPHPRRCSFEVLALCITTSAFALGLAIGRCSRQRQRADHLLPFNSNLPHPVLLICWPHLDMNSYGAADGSAAPRHQSPSPKPVQKTPSWTVSQHDEEVAIAAAQQDAPPNGLDVAAQEPTSLSPLDAYDAAAPAASPQGSHFSEALSLFGSQSDLTTPGYDDNFLDNSFGPMLTLHDHDALSPPTAANAPPPERHGIDPDQRPNVEVPTIEELEKQRTQDETKAGVRHWLDVTDPAPDDVVAQADKLRVANFNKRARAKSTGDAGNRRPRLHDSPKPTSALSPEAYLNLDDDEDDDDDDNDDNENEDDGNAYKDIDQNSDHSSDSEGSRRSTTPPARAEPFAQSNYAATPPPHRRSDSQETVTRGRPWVDSEFPPPNRTPSQPQSSSAAMAMFQQRARDIETASVSATIGSRRRSETDVSSLFSAAGISVRVPTQSSSRTPETPAPEAPAPQRPRRPSLLSKVLPRRSSSNLKKRKDGEESPPPAEALHGRKSSETSFAPPKRMSSWGRAKSPANIDVSAPPGLVRTSTGGSGIGISTPKWMANHIRRSRSPSGGLADIWRQAGGPPVAHLPQGDDMTQDQQVNAMTQVQHSNDDVPSKVAFPGSAEPIPPQVESRQQAPMDDDDDDGFIATGVAVPTAATHEAFKDHVLQLDVKNIMPHFMIERLASEQLKRYRRLAEAHHRHSTSNRCTSGASCAKVRSGPKLLPPKGAARTGDTAPVMFYIPTQFQPREETATGDGSTIMATFPAGVPLPPVPRLPAEFECPLCFQVKKIYKPSDWTKHVHEDVQPFTCTFPNCPETKSFKRKADWVRHENERHRHLEKWECSINNCGHQCFRKNNFQEHLVREHKLPEIRERRPTAASVANGAAESSAMADLIESCHIETTKQPTDEPCRFCGELCSTWKKLHVHLAAHLLSISMPILEMAGLGDIRLPVPSIQSDGQNLMLSDNDDGSQNSMSRNLSSSPSMTRSPGMQHIDASSRGGSTYPPPNFFQPPADQQQLNYLAVPNDDNLDQSQDHSFLTTPMHTYPPPAINHRRSVSATRSPSQSWLTADFEAELTSNTLGMHNQLGISEAPPQAPGMGYSQSAQGYNVSGQGSDGFYTTSPTYHSPNPNILSPNVNPGGFPTPVSHPHSQAQSRIVSPNPQQQSIGGALQSSPTPSFTNNGGHFLPAAPYTSGGQAATYPARTTTADDVKANINIVRKQLQLQEQAQQRALAHQQQQHRQQQQVQAQAQAQAQQVQHTQASYQQLNPQLNQQHHFYAEPQEGDFSAQHAAVYQGQPGSWVDTMYQQQPLEQQYMNGGQQVPYTTAPPPPQQQHGDW